jgi:hypothetical protein
VTVLVVATASVTLTLVSARARDASRDLGGVLSVEDHPSFDIRLGGALWRDRTIVDQSGRDFAAVAANESLRVLVNPTGSRRVERIELLVDGRTVSSVANPCRSCRSLRWTPTVPLPGHVEGDHRIEVVAADSGAYVATKGFSVHTEPRPRVIESQPVRGGDPRARMAVMSPAARRILERARTGTLRPLLGSAGLRIAQVGRLRAGQAVVGVTLLLDVHPARRNLRVRLPAYVLGADGPSRPQAIDARIAVLRDVLVDIDLRRGRLLAVEPGPRSATTSWRAPAPPGSKDED